MKFHQAYPGRGGDLDTELRGERVMLSGQAITVLESRLRPQSARLNTKKAGANPGLSRLSAKGDD